MEESLATSLGLQGENVKLSLKWTSKIQRTELNSKRVDLHISDVNDTERFVMNNVRTVQSLELPEQTLSQDLLESYSFLEGLPFQTYEKAVSRILIGLENKKFDCIVEHDWVGCSKEDHSGILKGLLLAYQ